MQRDPMVTLACQLFGKGTPGEQWIQAIVSCSALQVIVQADRTREIRFWAPTQHCCLEVCNVFDCSDHHQGRTFSEQKHQQSNSLREVLQRCIALILWVEWGCRLSRLVQLQTLMRVLLQPMLAQVFVLDAAAACCVWTAACLSH
jgi:hypothetical protein